MMYNVIPFIVALAWAACGAEVTAKPTALVHIGPHKTATTHFQAVVVAYEKLLQQHGYDIWPDVKKDLEPCHLSRFGRQKQVAGLANALFDHNCPEIVNRMRFFFNSSAKQNRNILLSAEKFAELILQDSKSLFDLLDGFHVHIVVTHRQRINLMISAFDQVVKNAKFLEFFPEYVMQAGSGDFRMMDILSAISAEVAPRGGEVSIIDYYGMMAANVDISYVIFCKVMNVLCHDSSLYEAVASLGSNPSVDIKNHLVANAFREFAVSRGCNYTMTATDHFANFNWKLAIPLRKYDMRKFADQSLLEDAALRERYGARILYGNLTANVAAVVKSYESVDRGVLMTDKGWMALFAKELKELQKKKQC